MSNQHQNGVIPPSPHESNLAEAHAYVEKARDLYRDEYAEYAGRRSEYQQTIAELATLEAEEIVDSTMEALLAMGGKTLPNNYEDVEIAGHTWGEFRSVFSRLLAGFGVMTSRLEHNHLIEKGYAELPPKEQMEVASVLFSDFLRHNALRFGVDSGAGLTKVRKKDIHNEEGGITRTREVVDRDIAENDHEIRRNMYKRGYISGNGTHVAGKISPEDYLRLRKAYSDETKDDHDYNAGFYQNLEKYYEDKAK